ncbi:MAG TPA: hypothetical protein VGL83_11125 [Stellaceae bacterium]|jgi:hypothetical protein
MQVAPTAAILEAIKVASPQSTARDASGARPQPKDWLAPKTIGRGQLIDLVV